MTVQYNIKLLQIRQKKIFPKRALYNNRKKSLLLSWAKNKSSEAENEYSYQVSLIIANFSDEKNY